MRVACLALGALACFAASLSFGQQDSKSPALDESANRSARLVANAKREGSLSLYASMAEKDLIRLVSEFERRYAIKVNVWRSGKNNVLRRAVTEARAGRFEVDVVHNPAPEMELLHRERLLQEVRSPYQRELIPEAVPRHREWPALASIFSCRPTTRAGSRPRSCRKHSRICSTRAGRDGSRSKRKNRNGSSRWSGKWARKAA